MIAGEHDSSIRCMMESQTSSKANASHLNDSLARNRRHGMRRVLGDLDGVRLPGESVDVLQ